MTRDQFFLILAAAVVPACTSNVAGPGDDSGSDLEGQSTSGGETSTFDHDNDQISPWDLIQRIEQEGPPEYTAHVHSCQKVRYANLGNILTDLGVNVNNTTALSAGDLYNSGYNAMGGPSYANRVRENIEITTSGASREFDIFAAAAPEVIANIGSLTRCQVGGAPATMFDGTSCSANGITCLLGVPASGDYLDLCNKTISTAMSQGDSQTQAQNLAVAALLSAAFTCE